VKLHPILGAMALGSATVIGIVGSAPQALASSHAAARPHARSCSSSSTAPSKYNTAKSSGSWQVPLDPCNPEGAGSASTPYYDCAYWAAEKRPDIWANAVDKYGYAVAPGGAWNVEIDARRAHYSISHKPTVGDIAAWPDNAKMGHTSSGWSYTASPGGHVAYVQKVHGSKITISTMGVANHSGRTETFIFNKKKAYFIHQAS
jgi:surface antigen